MENTWFLFEINKWNACDIVGNYWNTADFFFFLIVEILLNLLKINERKFSLLKVNETQLNCVGYV
jgi:hypothetical protein